MTRVAPHPIEPFFTARWSPRAMSGASLSAADLARLFEAARWAPSWGNSQPWRIAFAHRDTPAFKAFFDALVEGNQVWCTRAGVLLIICSRTHDDKGKPLPTHAFDTGAAWMSLALQASAMGLVAHGMGGFDPDKARAAAQVPPELAIHCMVALGHPGDVTLLPEKLQARETPNDRDPLEAHVVNGGFGAPATPSP